MEAKKPRIKKSRKSEAETSAPPPPSFQKRLNEPEAVAECSNATARQETMPTNKKNKITDSSIVADAAAECSTVTARMETIAKQNNNQKTDSSPADDAANCSDATARVETMATSNNNQKTDKSQANDAANCSNAIVTSIARPDEMATNNNNQKSVAVAVSLPLPVNIAASAPPDHEPFVSKIYPDLPSVKDSMIDGHAAELETADYLETFPPPFTDIQRQCFFEKHSDEFIQGLSKAFLKFEKNCMDHHWYIIPRNIYNDIQEYGKLSHKLSGTFVEERIAIQNKLTNLELEMWILDEKVFEATGVCADDREIAVKVKCTNAKLDVARGEAVLQTLSEALDERIKEEKMANMKCQQLRSSIEHFISNAEIQLMLQLISFLGHLIRQEECICTGVESCQYRSDLQRWFRWAVVACANSKNTAIVHVLQQVLRFPGSIGSWAVDLVQPLGKNKMLAITQGTPVLLVDSEQRGLLMMLSLILLPIEERNRFVRAGRLDECDDQLSFMWVDSDGESEDPTTERMLRPFSEPVMIALVNQIPFQQLFRALVHNLRKREVFCTVQAIVFAKAIVETLNIGCRTYSSIDRYRNLIKHLGRLIDHTVQYVADALRIQPIQRLEPIESRTRVHVEFDSFIYLVARCLHQARNEGMWQYTMSLPFDLLSTRALWRIYGAVRACDFDENRLAFTPADTNLSIRPEGNQLLLLEYNEFYYVVHTLRNMADARDWTINKQFIRVIVENFFELLTMVGPADELKGVLLVEQLRWLNEKNASTISILLKMVDTYRQSVVGCVAPHLSDFLRELFRNSAKCSGVWTAYETDVDILLTWFEVSAFDSPFYSNAIQLLTRIYYGNEVYNNRSGLPREAQVQMVRRIVSIYRLRSTAHGPEQTHTDSERLKLFQTHCLALLQQFHVHAMDQSTSDVQRVLQNPAAALRENFVKHLSDEPLLLPALDANCPVASLAAILITTVGHWVPIFCHEGLTLLGNITQHMPSLAIRCLELIVPLFASCTTSLSGNSKFLKLMASLVQQDQQSSRTSKGLVGPLQMMMVSQVSQYQLYGFLSPMVLVRFWTESIIRSSKDLATDDPAQQLLEKLAYASVPFRDAWCEMRNALAPFFKDPTKVKPAKSRLGQLVQMFIPGEQTSLYINMSREYVALALMAFEVEHQQLEVQNGLWPELVRLLARDQSIALDDGLMRVCGTLQLDYCPPSRMLVLYKQACLLIRIDPTHALYPLLCQQFFTILLERVEYSDMDQIPNAFDNFGVKDRLLEFEPGITEKLKKCFSKAEQHYTKRQSEEKSNNNLQALYGYIVNVFKAFSLWLQDKHLDLMRIEDLTRLSAQNDVSRLKQTFQGCQDLWVELVDWRELQTIQRTAVEGWKQRFRWSTQHRETLPNNGRRDKPGERGRELAEAINRRLASYDAPIPLTEITLEGIVGLASTDGTYSHASALINRIVNGLHSIHQYTERLYRPTIIEFNRLKKDIFEKTKLLYTNNSMLVRETAKCTFFCSGPRAVHVRVEKATRSNHISQRLEDCRRDFSSTVEAAIYLPPHIMRDIVKVTLLSCSLLKNLHIMESPTEVQKLTVLLRNLLQYLFAMLQDDSSDHFVYPVNYFIDRCMEEIPETVNEEIFTLIKKACNNHQQLPNAVMRLLALKKISLEQLERIYGFLTNHKGYFQRQFFLILFGEKFNFSSWLAVTQVSPQEVGRLLEIIAVPLLMVANPAIVVSEGINVSFFEMVVKHAVELAYYKYPSNFCSVLQLLLKSVSSANTELPPTAMRLLINAMREKLGLPELSLAMDNFTLMQEHCHFAAKNATITDEGFSLPLARTVVQLIANHFANERLHAASELYVHHDKYVPTLALLLGSIAHTYVVLSTDGNSGLTDRMLPTILSLFEPWLVPYTNASRIMTQPWMPESDKSALIMLRTLQLVITATINRLDAEEFGPVSVSNVLSQLLTWYVSHYTSPTVSNNVLTLLHSRLQLLSWKKLLPSDAVVDACNKGLMGTDQESTVFVWMAFTHCQWKTADTTWLEAVPSTRARLLLLSTKLALEPDVYKSKNSLPIMASVLKYIGLLPWKSLDCTGLELAMDWFTNTAKPQLILRSPTSPFHEVENAILDLLEVASGMTSNAINPLSATTSATNKRARFLRTAMRQLTVVALSCKKNEAANVKQLVRAAIRRQLSMIVKLLEEFPVSTGSQNTGSYSQRREARELVNAMLAGNLTGWDDVPFSSAVMEVLQLESNVSIPFALAILEASKLFASPSHSMVALFDTALDVSINTFHEPDGWSWIHALELVHPDTVQEWSPHMLASSGHYFCLQLYFLVMLRNITNKASKPTIGYLRDMFSSLKSSKKVTNEFHVYPLWISMLYALLASARTVPKLQMSGIVREFAEYLLIIGEQAPAGWIVGFVQTLMANKTAVSASQRIIAIGLAYCLSSAYRTLQSNADERVAREGDQETNSRISSVTKTDGNEGGAGPCDEDGDSSSTTSLKGEPIDAMRKTLSDPSLAEYHHQVDALLVVLPVQLDIDSMLRLAKSIVEKFDPRATPILRTLNDALNDSMPRDVPT